MKSLKSFDSLYKVIADNALMGFLIFQAEGEKECIYANSLAMELMEIPSEEQVKPFKIHDLVPPRVSEKLRPFDQNLLQSDGFYQDVVIKKQNQNTFIANLGVKLLHLNDQPHYLLMVQDITIQKKLQRDLVAKQTAIKAAYEELLTQNKKLKELDVAKNRFVALTTHELRTPLSAIIASTEIIKLKLYDSPEQLNEFVEMIWDQAHHLSELVNDILDFSKIQAGKMDFYIGLHDLTHLVSEEVEALRSMAEASSVTLTFEHPSKLCPCYFDDVRLKQVIANITNNAIKYNKTCGYVKVWIEEKEETFEVHIEDSGRGIASQDIPKVFDEFETFGKVSHHQKGTGLGMPISKRLMEGMGGNILLTSQENVGSHFWITIPKNKVLPEENYRDRHDSFDLAS